MTKCPSMYITVGCTYLFHFIVLYVVAEGVVEAQVDPAGLLNVNLFRGDAIDAPGHTEQENGGLKGDGSQRRYKQGPQMAP